MLKVGDKAPEFTLPDQDGKEHSLSDYKGKWVLVYFYPKDDTPGCTKEACAIRDTHPSFGKLHAKVFGVSADSVESHKKFATKFKIPFDLLADPEKKMITAYDVWQKKSMYGREYMGIVRSSFLIDPAGKIAKIYAKVKPDVHADEVLADLKTLGA
jgi:thioredoxin-dependent peroxiredoxin